MSSPRSCPIVMISAAASGQGKTTVASALARLHARQGRWVRAFKVGPDFLDPGWLALATGAPVHPLDLWMTGEADCLARLHAAAGEADLIVVEGVMGLFDGEPSAADLAQRFGLPVLAVIDASGMAGTFGAVAHGLKHFRPGLPWAGVIANRVAGERHAQMLGTSLADAQDWLGGLPRDAAFSLPERHLGLARASELDDALQRLDAAADALASTELGAMDLSALARWSVQLPAPQAHPEPPQPLSGHTIAIARDAAFCFIYQGNLDTLEALGARLAFFSPLADQALPECDALWLPGGYPELHAGEFSANAGMRASIARHVGAGRPVWAECGGMMALFQELETLDGTIHPGWGVLPGRVTMKPRLAALGPQQLGLKAGMLRGHTFHYSTCATPLAPITHASRPRGPLAGQPGEAVYAQGPVRASYFHAWFAASPAAAASLFLPGEPA